MERHRIASEELAYLVPHQANMRIIDAVGRRMGLEPEKVMINVEKYGNTTTAIIPLCMWEWEQKIRKGDKLILGVLKIQVFSFLFFSALHQIRYLELKTEN